MSSKAIIICVLPRFGGAIWWMLARQRPTWSDCWQNLGAVCFWQPIPSGL